MLELRSETKEMPGHSSWSWLFGFWACVAIASHKLVNPPWRDAGGFEPKRKTCQRTQ